MGQLIPGTLNLIILGLVLAVATMFATMHALSRMYRALAAPLATVERDNTIPYPKGLLCLFAAYFLCAMIFSFTGGTIGMSPDEWSPEATRSHLLWGFSAGLLIAALARISAVYFSTNLADYLQLLTAAALGVLTLKLTHDLGFISRLFDDVIRPAGGQHFPAFCALSALATLGVVEGGIRLCKGIPRANEIPYSLLRQRMEQYTRVQQVFWPHDVVEETENTLRRVIMEEGLQELCWLTHTAPESHMPTALAALREWLRRKYGATADVEEQSEQIFRAAVRVVVSSHQSETELRQLHYLERIQRLQHPVRVRLLIINGTHAVVHLPIPYQGGENEQSNCAHLISSPELVYPFREEFDALWENQQLLCAVQGVVELIVSGDLGLRSTACIIYRSHNPITYELLAHELSKMLEEELPEEKVRNYVLGLERKGLVRLVGDDRVAPTRYTRTCRAADVFRRFGV